MVELRPYPFAALLTRMLRELDERDSIFGLPRASFFLGDPRHDLSVSMHGRRASCSLGPAAGPHTQMAQNVVLAWLAGCRVFELKTVQENDRLTIPRPCIDVRTVGLNAEWSQELLLEQSLAEYVKAAMLIEVLRSSGVLTIGPGYGDSIYDLSVGYDLAGIKSDRVQRFLDGMLDCSAVVDELRAEIPPELAHLAELDFPTRLSDTLTLSTFHGCPPDEIEGIVLHLFEERRLNSVVKLNPTLLGPARVRELLHDRLGYHELRVPDVAFERDPTFDQMAELTERLRMRAFELELGFGLKLTNTLIVENDGGFLAPEPEEVYLSGQPLHVLAMHLVRDVRREFGTRLPLSFSAGIDRHNFPDAVALGMLPVTTCTDLLRVGGYGRAAKYLVELGHRMDKVDACDVEGWILRAYGNDGGSVDEALRNNTEHYVEHVTDDARYSAARNARPPKKIGSQLVLLDCITCDKCLPVCPNAALFRLDLPDGEIPIDRVRYADGRFVGRADGTIQVTERHQIALFADFCNECGNCDVFCPEDGGPYATKALLFGTLADWKEFAQLDGFHHGRERFHARVGGAEYVLEPSPGGMRFTGPEFDVTFEPQQPLETLAGTLTGELDLGLFRLLERIREELASPGSQAYSALGSE